MAPDSVLPEHASVFQQTYRNYLNQIRTMDLPARAPRLGVREIAMGLEIPFLSEPHRVSATDISTATGERPSFAVRLILLKYILLCPPEIPRSGSWQPYHGFKDSGPLGVYFPNTAEKPIAEHFAGRLPALESASRQLGGQAPRTPLPYDSCWQFTALPRLPLLVAFNDRDSDFPAQGTILFRESADQFLDAECLAILGGVLARRLIAAT